ncbi:MAG: dicarboxylate/amino acid:cation symporter [Limisphaerales bacterium]|jgi:proton glutamate symport protein
MAWYKQLHWQILLGMALGALFGVAAAQYGWGQFTTDWVAPFGTIFLNLLKLIAMPLVITSLICGVASLSDFKKLSRMGGKTIGLYLATTAVAVTIGLLVVNAIKPGDRLPNETKAQLEAKYQADATKRQETTATVKERGPLQPLIDMVPDNFFGSASSNRNMLQIVFFSLLAGIALVQVREEKRRPVIEVISGLQEMVIRITFLIMLFAPVGVFALIASTITNMAGEDPSQVISLLGSLAWYCLAVIIGLLIHGSIVYLGLLKIFTSLSIPHFFRSIGQAQLLAFSTSSSGATLPVTMKCVEEKLGASKEVSSFVLPLGATINMDGTALYQAVAAVFIAQASGIDLTTGAQITIVLTAVLASVGTAAVPGAGIVMLIIILEAINVPAAGIALILGVDRILDMCRTAVNVTGDAAVTAVIAASEKQLDPPPAPNA